MSLDSILAKMYNSDRRVESLEKTAEDNMFSALMATGDVEPPVSENPFENMSTKELAAYALQLEEQEKIAAAGGAPDHDLSELEKIAADKLAGEVMAHSMVDEFGQIKLAMANGLCRVCKENPMDIVGSSIGSCCMPDDE